MIVTDAIPEGVEKFSGVDDIGRNSCFPIEFIHKVDQFLWVAGVSAEMIAMQQASAFGLFRREDRWRGGGKGVDAFQDRDPYNRLTWQRGADQAQEHRSGADGAEDMGIVDAVDRAKDLFTAQDAEQAGSPFRDDICAGVTQRELMEKMGIGLFDIILAADKFQLHSVPESGRQGGGKDWWSFPTDDADSVQPRLVSCIGGCDEVIGPGAAKGDDRICG